MDPAELSSEEWCSLSGLYTAEEADFMAQLLGNCQVPNSLYGNFNLELPSALWSAHKSTIMSVTAGTSSTSHFPQNADNSNTDFLSSLQGSSSIADFYKEVAPMEVQKNKRNVKSRKKQKTSFISDMEEDRSPGHQEQSLRSEDDDSKASQELNAGGSTSLSLEDSTGLKLNEKSRSNRGSANYPQCIYAKRRRERINERLRILQNLVPNGTKVDISTMLEEAVQYVKFLQLQIKLLSSDDLWMYAPIAYNGMNIGLDLNITKTKQQ